MNLPKSSDRDYEYTGYVGLCVQCGHQYYGPKRTVLCKICLDRANKKVDTLKENV